MIDEIDLSQELSWFYEARTKRVVANLKKNNINAVYAPDKKKALAAVIDVIPEGARVVRGDSISVDQVGVIEELKKRNRNEVIDPFEFEHGEEQDKVQREAFLADVFITGANAVTLDGKLVSTDGHGNRVAPVIFGPKKVVLVIGANKIVSDLESALKRIREIAAPINAKRQALKHNRADFAQLPCVITGFCADCNHEWRICRYTTIIEGSMLSEKDRINVVLVGEALGI
jgi:hypothetical protein